MGSSSWWTVRLLWVRCGSSGGPAEPANVAARGVASSYVALRGGSQGAWHAGAPLEGGGRDFPQWGGRPGGATDVDPQGAASVRPRGI